MAERTDSGEVKVRTPEEAAFVKHYDRLTGALPIVKLLPKFISKRIISFSEQEKILAGETDFDKRKRFLDHITTHFNTGNTYTFYKFLEVLEAHGGPYTYLATDMKKTLEENNQQEQENNVSHPFQVQDDDDVTNVTLEVPLLAPGSSTMMMTPVGPPLGGGEYLRSINETAELTSIPVTEERINVAEERISATKVQRYHGSSHPELADLIEHVGSFVATRWFNLGLRLGVNSHTLDRIEQDTRDSDSACRKMFQAWLRDKSKGTWNDVITALKSNSVGENGVAEKLEEMIT